MAYIDVRGPWPVLVIGMRTHVLEGASRSITVEEACELVGETIDDEFEDEVDEEEIGEEVN